MDEALNLYEKLSVICAAEQPLEVRKNVVVSEHRTTYRAVIRPGRMTAVFRIDGGLITSGRRCDKLILSEYPGSAGFWKCHFIELKGCRTCDAIVQLENTLRNKMFSDKSISERHARIVGMSFPSSKADPDFERARSRFAAEYGCVLKRVKSGNPEAL